MSSRTIHNYHHAGLRFSAILTFGYWCVLCQLLAASDWFGIQIVDQDTKRGIPLAKLKTTDNTEYWTDNQGWIAFLEPGMMGKDIYFSIESPGYEYPKDGFEFQGFKLRTHPGARVQVAMNRANKAERLHRVTGNGLYRDSELLGIPTPDNRSSWNAGVMGSDSVQMLPYRGKLFWIWGDTNLAHYPLGNFHVTAATSPMPKSDKTKIRQELIDNAPYLTYFVDQESGSPKKILPDDAPGAVWLFGAFTIYDEHQNEMLIAHYSRHLSLGTMVEHGIAIWNDEKEIFEKKVTFDVLNNWQHPRGQAVQVKQSEGDFIYFVESFANTRVPANLNAILDPNQYQSLAWDAKSKTYQWQSTLPPTTQKEEQAKLLANEMRSSDARYNLQSNEESISMHRSSIEWNSFRKRWILIGNEINLKSAPSHLGEVWFAESDSIDGPWMNATKIATHPKQSFYNPRQHPVFSSDDGRIIYFEGTYTQSFSGNPIATPRYEYNQLMYRLDLSQFANLSD
ncbi:MAG: hypothetical protein ACK5YR_24285 [Pirellula sp.]